MDPLTVFLLPLDSVHMGKNSGSVGGSEAKINLYIKENETPGVLGFLELMFRAKEHKISSRPGFCRKNGEKSERGPGEAGTVSGGFASDSLPSPSLLLPSIQGPSCSEKWELGRQAGVLCSSSITATTSIPTRLVFAHPLPFCS